MALEDLAQHHSTLCIFLSATLTTQVQQALYKAGWKEDSPILIVQKASWPGEEKILRTDLAHFPQTMKAEGIKSQAMIIASPALGARHWEELKTSKLYDAGYSHKFRKAQGQ